MALFQFNHFKIISLQQQCCFLHHSNIVRGGNMTSFRPFTKSFIKMCTNPIPNSVYMSRSARDFRRSFLLCAQTLFHARFRHVTSRTGGGVAVVWKFASDFAYAQIRLFYKTVKCSCAHQNGHLYDRKEIRRSEVLLHDYFEGLSRGFPLHEFSHGFDLAVNLKHL